VSDEAMSPAPFARHLSAIVEKRIEQLAGAVQESHGGRSVEAVHDMRVASRRLRALGVTFRDLLRDGTQRRLEKKLRRVTRAAGTVRDLDVQMALLEGRRTAATKELERAALEHLLEMLTVRRAEATRRTERRLEKLDIDSVRGVVRRAAREVMRGLPTPEAQRAYALTLLEERVNDAAERVPPLDGAEHPEELHQLRIDIKEIRYALELFEPLLGAHFPALHERARALQDLLGIHHDLVTLGDVVREHSQELDQRGRAALAGALDGLGEALSAERAAVLMRFQTHGFDPLGWHETLQHAAG
jgi:CHAD domain-containing protein